MLFLWSTSRRRLRLATLLVRSLTGGSPAWKVTFSAQAAVNAIESIARFLPDDFNRVSEQEVLHHMKYGTSGRVQH